MDETRKPIFDFTGYITSAGSPPPPKRSAGGENLSSQAVNSNLRLVATTICRAGLMTGAACVRL